MSLYKYITSFSSLRMNPSSGHKSPHKVCLLLAIIDLIEEGKITENKIIFNQQLKDKFTKHFEYLRQDNDRNEPFQPFFYLSNEKFWHHKFRKGEQKEYIQRNNDRKAGSEKIVNRLIEYAYLDDQLFDYLQSQVCRNQIRQALGSNIKDFSRQFERWALSIGKSPKTIKNYIGAIGGSISHWAEEAGITNQNLLSIYSYNNFKNITEHARKLETFMIRDATGNGMYSAAINCYEEFLSDLTQETVVEDVQSILEDQTTDSTTKATLVNARIGQGLFRDKLLDFWQGCALTGYKDPCFLVASHIKPWRASNDYERLDVYNGVLLLPNLDKAFDKGFITFSSKGNIKISDHMEEPEKIGVNDDMIINLRDQHQDYLSYHRGIVFKK